MILERFAALPRTEGAFYLKFRTLAPMEIEALGKLFRRIDRFFGV